MVHSNSGSGGFTAINHCDRVAAHGLAAPRPATPDQPIVPRNREACRSSAARRSKIKPFVKRYLLPGRSAGVSMFERAALSYGEESQVKKRKALRASREDKKRDGEPGTHVQPKSDASGTRVISEGMRISKPFASPAVEAQHPIFSPKSAAEKLDNNVPGDWLNSPHISRIDCSSGMDDSMSVISPFTSIDVFSARPSSSQWRSHSQSRSRQVATFGEEFEASAIAASRRNDDRSDSCFQALETAACDGSEMFDDNISDTDLLLSLETIAGPSQAGTVGDFEAKEASRSPATILNQAFSNTQEIQATPVAVSTTCEDGRVVRPPEAEPIVRPPFPEPAQERSSILGLTSATYLRVCFRIGEALKVGMKAVHDRQSVVIELYARVRLSFREPRSTKQHFSFMDLFHDRPPYLDGTYDGWKDVPLNEHDSGKFLERPSRPLACRCIGKLERDGTSWRLTIASVWEASRDDVEHVLRVIQS